jgi:hypothetical protein
MLNTITLKTPLSANMLKEEQASSTNPILSWMDFVFTDDRPNDNGVGVRAEQFASLIATGIYMPLKVAEGQVAPGHENALPLGVITNLVEKYSEVDQAKQLIGKAALWAEERPEDVAQLKSAFAAGEQLQISWELLYSDEEVDDNGTRWLKDPVVRAATIVGIPAYSGRTPVLAVASKTSDNSLEDNKVELEELQTKLAEATNEVEGLKAQVAEFETKNTEKDAELETLRTFKAEVEQKEARAALLQNRLTAFAEAGLEFSPEDISAKQEQWLQMDDEAFNFLVNELKGIKVATASRDQSHTDPVIPEPTGSNGGAKLTAEILKIALKSK